MRKTNRAQYLLVQPEISPRKGGTFYEIHRVEIMIRGHRETDPCPILKLRSGELDIYLFKIASNSMRSYWAMAGKLPWRCGPNRTFC